MLGPLMVEVGGAIVEIPRGKQRALVGLLATQAGGVGSGDPIIEDLWGDRTPVAAVASLHAHVSRLRRALSTEPGVLFTQGNGNRLVLADVASRTKQGAGPRAGPVAGTGARRLRRRTVGRHRGHPI